MHGAGWWCAESSVSEPCTGTDALAGQAGVQSPEPLRFRHANDLDLTVGGRDVIVTGRCPACFSVSYLSMLDYPQVS